MKSLVTSMSSPLVESSLCKIQQRHTYFTLKIIFSGQWEPYSKKGNILFALWLCSKNKRKMARETTGWPYKQRVPALKSKSCILQTWIFTQCSLYSWQAWRQRDSDLIKTFSFPVLAIESRALHMLGKGSLPLSHPQAGPGLYRPKTVQFSKVSTFTLSVINNEM